MVDITENSFIINIDDYYYENSYLKKGRGKS